MSGPNIKTLARQAMLRSINVRSSHSLDLTGPLDVYALCKAMGVKVRFVDIASMEGMYGGGELGPVILVSSLRPLPRRNFTCAHELAHHVFGHGSTIDELLQEPRTTGSFPRRPFAPNEFVADTFAGYLLMPVLGVRHAFASRGWDVKIATPLQAFTVACHFGVGYGTLVHHLRALRAISSGRADALRKVTPKDIRTEMLGTTTAAPLVVADEHWSLPTVDAEVGTLLLLPIGATGDHELSLVPESRISRGCLFRAVRPGITHIAQPDAAWSVFVRISRFQFTGFAEYRHLEQEGDDDE